MEELLPAFASLHRRKHSPQHATATTLNVHLNLARSMEGCFPYLVFFEQCEFLELFEGKKLHLLFNIWFCFVF